MFELYYIVVLSETDVGSRDLRHVGESVTASRTDIIDAFTPVHKISFLPRRGTREKRPTALAKISLDIYLSPETRKIVAWRARRDYGPRRETARRPSPFRLRINPALVFRTRM